MAVNYNDGPFTYDDAMMHFSYDQYTGIVRSASNRRNVHIGDIVGSKDRQGYLVTTLFKRPVKLHRLAWLLTYQEWPNGQIDHINGDKSDNRIANLRVVTNSENKQNLTLSVANTSGHLGVSFHKASGKWRSTIKINGKSRHLGLYETVDLATRSYKDAKEKLHPFNEVYK